MLMKKIGFIILLTGLACKQKTPEQQLKSFVEDPGNKITQMINLSDVRIVTKYLPTSYRSVINNLSDSVLMDDDGFYYFNVKFEKKTGEKPGKEKLLYLTFDMQKDFVLMMNDRDSIAPVICQKIENGISGSYEYMIAFEIMSKEKLKNDFKLFYNDKIFGIGTVAFVYKQEDLKRIPMIKNKLAK